MKDSSVALYIHIPFCLSKCSYCDFFSVPCGKNASSVIPDSYIEALCAELLFRKTEFSANSFKTVYIGGGTPSLLTASQLKRLSSAIYSVSLKKDFEFTIEVNPDDVTEVFLESCMACGINRLSLGVQALDDSVLKNVFRRSDSKTVKNALSLIKSNWNGVFSADLISALPGQSVKSFEEGLFSVMECNPHHISLYSLSIEEHTPLAAALDSGKIEYDFDAADDMWILGRNLLVKNGYEQYEVSNFCKSGYECAHNIAYWNTESYIGLGSGATGTLHTAKSVRYTNTKEIGEYISFWTTFANDKKNKLPQQVELLSKKVLELEFFMMGMRRAAGVSFEEFSRRFGHEVPVRIKEVMKKWQKNGLMNIQKSAGDEKMSLNSEGLLFLNRFLSEIID